MMKRERKEVYYVAWDMPWEETEEALSSTSAIFQGTDMGYRFKIDKRTEGRGQRYA
jgi:hypothetical protein